MYIFIDKDGIATEKASLKELSKVLYDKTSYHGCLLSSELFSENDEMTKLIADCKSAEELAKILQQEKDLSFACNPSSVAPECFRAMIVEENENIENYNNGHLAFSNVNMNYIEEATKARLEKETPQEGDWLKTKDGEYINITAIHSDGDFQASLNNYMFIYPSGTVEPSGIMGECMGNVNNLITKGEIKDTGNWFFAGGRPKAHSSVQARIPAKVWQFK